MKLIKLPYTGSYVNPDHILCVDPIKDDDDATIQSSVTFVTGTHQFNILFTHDADTVAAAINKAIRDAREDV
jgi:hypothetical protein